ncbi:MAG: hypothetical protein PHC50_03505 [Candidatus Cloacimonetes bacterium]|nr:hypothetical protein [Candidatus Cloacimonadota bacterium]
MCKRHEEKVLLEREMLLMNMAAMFQLSVEKATVAMGMCADNTELCKTWYAIVLEMGEKMDKLIGREVQNETI